MDSRKYQYKEIEDIEKALSDPAVYSDPNERCFQHEVEHRFRNYSNTDSDAARTVA